MSEHDEEGPSQTLEEIAEWVASYMLGRASRHNHDRNLILGVLIAVRRVALMDAANATRALLAQPPATIIEKSELIPPEEEP